MVSMQEAIKVLEREMTSITGYIESCEKDYNDAVNTAGLVDAEYIRLKRLDNLRLMALAENRLRGIRAAVTLLKEGM